MSKESIDLDTLRDKSPRIIILGGVAGAAIGVLAAYLWLQRTNKGQPAEFNLGEGVKIGALVVALLRNIANL
jgi:high-affinity Fe2+/Pb2+ permease